MIAESYRKSNRIHDAAEYYQKAIDQGIQNDNAFFYYAFALKAKGNYEGAKQQLKQYVKYGTNFGYLERARHELKNLKELEEIAMEKPDYKVGNMEDLNTEAIEYHPVMYDENTMYFTSSRGEGVTYMGQGTRFTDIYKYKFDGISEYSGAVIKIPDVINQEKTHEASATFSADGKTMIFARSNTGKKKDPTKEVDLYESKMLNGRWTEPRRLENISEAYAWDSNPYLNASGDTLFFASNREGGYGGDDIYFATKDDYEEWSNVQNMGELVNTEAIEQFPYFYKGTFYFSSDGHPGFGGLDLFKLAPKPNGDTLVHNLGKPVNSGYDDFAIYFTGDSSGFFTSNRPEGKGDDDIWYFGYKPTCDYVLKGYVKGNVTDKKRVTDEMAFLPNSTVILLDTNENVIRTTDSDSTGYFELEVKPEKYYRLKANHDGFITREESFNTVGEGIDKEYYDALCDVEIVTNVGLLPIVDSMVLDFPPIYYDYNKWDIREDAAKVLYQMEKVLHDNPSILVEIGSHTDPRNTVNYNDLLSQKRAESAVNHIIEKGGIDPSRLVAKGYGERVPYVMQKDTNGLKKGTVLTHEFIKSIEDEELQKFAYQLNRRTEFRIIGTIDKAVDPDHIQVEKHGEKDQVIEKEKADHEKEIMKKYLIEDEEDLKEIEKLENKDK